MHRSPAITAARHFIEVATKGEPPSDALLLRVLDALLVGYHDLPDHKPAVDPDLPEPDNPEPPERDLKALYRCLQERFPSLGLYPVCDPTKDPGGSAHVADAIDDLTDITSDMHEVIWLADNVGEAAANHAYKVLYIHWGLHVRELALLLHARRFS